MCLGHYLAAMTEPFRPWGKFISGIRLHKGAKVFTG
jgi:hypothetical protein